MATSPESPPPDDNAPTNVPARTVSHASIMVRSNAIVVLALIAVVVFLNWAQAVLIPITLSVFLSYALKPIVNWLQRKAKLPKAIGAAATLAVILGAVGWGLNSLQPEALDVLDIVPRATEKFSIALRGNPREPYHARKMLGRGDRADRPAADHPSALHQADGRAEAFELREDVRRNQDRRSLIAQRAKEIP